MKRKHKVKKSFRLSHVTPEAGQILLFPHLDKAVAQIRNSESLGESRADTTMAGKSVVLCGTYRKDPEGLRKTFESLKDHGFSVLSPGNVFIEGEQDGFVYMRHESTQSPRQLENKHLDAILRADFVWFFAPDGYVGPTGALEVGFARANGIPVYCDTPLKDILIKEFVDIVDSPMSVFEHFRSNRVPPPPPAVTAFQHYYRRAAISRGYSKESASDCLLLMLEEFGELARALRKRDGLARNGTDHQHDESAELADIFIYVVHLANVLQIDLSSIVQAKETSNIRKYLNGK